MHTGDAQSGRKQNGNGMGGGSTGQISLEQYALAVLGSRDGIWDWDLRTNSLFLSPRWKEMLGYADEELPNVFHTFDSLIHEDDKARVMAYVEDYLQGQHEWYAIDFRMRHKAGHYLWIRARGAALRDEKGIPFRMAGSHTDITSRKKAEEELQESEARLRAITESAQDAIIMMNPAGKVSYWNPAAEEILGYRHEEIIGRDLHQMLAPARYHEAHQNAFPVFKQRGEGNAIGETLELHARHKAGHEITIELSLSAVWIQDAWHAVGIMRDITQRKQEREALEKANRDLEEAIEKANAMTLRAEAANIAKSQFLANMSHEIRTPMNGVIGMTELLLTSNLEPEQRHFAEIIHSSGTALLDIINDILDFSKIEADRLELEKIDFDLRTMIEECAELTVPRAEEKGLAFHCIIAPEVPALVRGDPGRIRQILTNLTGNAIKFTKEGEVAVAVSLAEEEAGTVRVRFSVRDTGIGIASEKLEMLFHAFEQLDVSTTRKFGGTGLGLVISRRLAEMMGGGIGVESSEGRGSDFWFTVLLEKQNAAAGRRENTQTASLAGTRVLIIGDNTAHRHALCAALEAREIRAAEAESGEEALEMLGAAARKGDAFQIALLDMHMPENDSEFIGRTILSDEALRATRIVMMVSVGQRGDAKRLQDAGFAAYITKPVRESRLLHCMAMLLKSGAESGHSPVAAPRMITRHSVREELRAGCRILLAEDNKVNQMVAQKILERLGYSAKIAENGLKAAEACKTAAYDLVFMDIQMPVMDGFAAARRIRQNEKTAGRQPVPIIAMTANAMKGDREKCLKGGMDDYISKPVTVEGIGKMLDKWLQFEKEAAE
jgi:PAS domain S-box-containing protein